MTATMSEYQYVLSMGDELGEYADEWIAVVDNKIVARGKNAKEVYEKAKSYDSSKMPFIMRVPTSKVMVL
jgi:peptidyl-tRNA hydrolase